MKRWEASEHRSRFAKRLHSSPREFVSVPSLKWCGELKYELAAYVRLEVISSHSSECCCVRLLSLVCIEGQSMGGRYIAMNLGSG